MNEITKAARLEGYLKRPVTRRQAEILQAMGDDLLTAREICQRLGYSDLNAVKPRLTELMQMGVIQPLGRVKDEVTGIKVTVWEVIKDGKENS